MNRLLVWGGIALYFAVMAGLAYLTTPPPEQGATLRPKLSAPAPAAKAAPERAPARRRVELSAPAPAAKAAPERAPARRRVELSAEARSCLVKNLYWEARGEGYRGMRMVAKVTLNRVRDAQWPGSVCEVVRQPAQFSWVHRIRWNRPMRNAHVLRMARQIVRELKANGYTPSGRDGVWAHHYVRKDIHWKYARSLECLGDVGNHRFYS